MIVAGVDPGTLKTGYGVVSREGSRLRPLCYGVLAPRADLPLAVRLVEIHRGLLDLFSRYRPSAVAVEDIFYHKNARSALVLGHARGVALLAAAELGIPVHAYPPAQVKRALIGSGRSSKAQIQEVLKAILGFDELPPPDASDAIAIAICHANAAGCMRP